MGFEGSGFVGSPENGGLTLLRLPTQLYPYMTWKSVTLYNMR